MKLPNIGHSAPYLNIYVLTKHDVEANFTPFIIHNSRSERYNKEARRKTAGFLKTESGI